jgi:hypothetical protein
VGCRPHLASKGIAIVSVSSQKKPRQAELIDVWRLNPSPENAKLYRERTIEDSDFARLVESIRANGVQAPLLVSLDFYIISGHQRLRAAIEAGRYKVPCIRLNLRRSKHTADEWLAILREHNTGREKTFDEMVREKLIDIDPQEAMDNLAADRIKRTRVRMPTVELGGRVRRNGFSPALRPFCERIKEILNRLQDYLPVNERAVHYRLLNLLIMRNVKDGLWYENNKQSSKSLSDVLTRLRIHGEVPFESICDETRPVTEWTCWRDGPEFIKEQSEDLFRSYARNLLQSQSTHFEIVVEKLTVKNFVEPVAMRYRMPVVIMRGNSGIDARYRISKRFKASGKSKLLLICLGDCDPDGDKIVESTVRSMRDDFWICGVEGVRVAMTHEQADELKLPKNLEAKITSCSYKNFVKRHGRTDCYELEAVEPEVLQNWLDEAIRSVIDIEAYNHEVDREHQDAAEIQARREAVIQVIKTERTD